MAYFFSNYHVLSFLFGMNAPNFSVELWLVAIVPFFIDSGMFR